MKFAVLGTGQVGGTIGRKLAELGHDVMFGSRSPASSKSLALAQSADAAIGTYGEAAAHGDLIVNALPGEEAIGVLAGCDIAGKILIDIANYNSAVDQPIGVTVGESIQAAFPAVRLVKALNSVSAHLMVDPVALGAPHSVFIASDDPEAKAEVTLLLRAFGWSDILDLGDLTACRAMEQLIPLWMALEKRFGHPHFNLAVISGEPPAT